MDQGYTVIRVKRKVTEDPEKGLQLTAKKRKLDLSSLTFEYAGSLPLGSDAAKAFQIAKTPTRKRNANHLATNENLNTTEVTDNLSTKIARKKEDEDARIYDIIHEDIANKKENIISINGVAMLREKLNISEQEEELAQYVYDIYYAPRNMEINRDELSFEAVDLDYYEYQDHRPEWEEEDDSNDEDNWRNDYPEEDSSFTSNERNSYDRGEFSSDRSETGFDSVPDFYSDD